MRLGTGTVVKYLTDRGVVPESPTASADALGGGVSNSVFRVRSNGADVVVKQPYPDLNVEAEWPADVDRVHNEAAAARVYADVLEASDVRGVEVPAVEFEDTEEHVIVISSAPVEARMWKSDLLDGRVDSDVAATLGSFLAAAHEYATGNETIERTFENYTPFEQLRLKPYHETVASRHPDVAAPIERELERIRGARSTLVHGDYSPKNVLVDDTGGQTRIWVLDFEAAHWGDPAFDAAFMLNHLFIKSMYLADRREEYVAAAESFWDAYADAFDEATRREEAVVTELAVLLLARVDGKSPVEYVKRADTKDRLRTVAKRILTEDRATIADVVAVLNGEAEEE